MVVTFSTTPFPPDPRLSESPTSWAPGATWSTRLHMLVPAAPHLDTGHLCGARSVWIRIGACGRRGCPRALAGAHGSASSCWRFPFPVHALVARVEAHFSPGAARASSCAAVSTSSLGCSFSEAPKMNSKDVTQSVFKSVLKLYKFNEKFSSHL